MILKKAIRYKKRLPYLCEKIIAYSGVIMACDHKFKSELELDVIGYEPETLITGTFCPGIPVNSAEWFYGRTDNNYFWHVLPLLYGEASLINATANEWKAFCRDKKIALTDLISSIDDADPGNKEHYRILSGFSDKALMYNFDGFEYVNIAKILQSHPTIKNVYLTRGITEAYWRHLWNPVMLYCSHHKLHERKLLTPTDEVGYHHEAYNKQHPDAPISKPGDYVLMRWKEEWHTL